MSDETATMIPPALTPEEWAKVQRDTLMPYDAFDAISAFGMSRPSNADSAVALIALANAALPDRDPRKITRADVDALRQLAGTVRIPTGDGMTFLTPGGGPPWATALAAKLAALLPPEGT